MTDSPLRLRLDAAALTANWTLLSHLSGAAACGAAVKANGYGLGARGVVARLAAAGCRDVFVATWAEARDVAGLGVSISVLHGVRAEDLAERPANARPVLASVEQVRRWRDAGGGACDVMVDTGMNRLGVSPQHVADGLLDGLTIDTLMSHLVSADEDVPLNARQRDSFAALAGRTSARRMSLANSAGIALGPDYHFDLTRPGIALYGGRQRQAHAGIRQVVTPEAQILQRRRVPAGETIGYNATYTAPHDMEVAILNLGYADGYLRCFSNKGGAHAGDAVLPVVGRVSMDLTALCVDAAPDLAEGDWVAMDYALPQTAALSGLSQYELLTGLGARFDRVWA
ncbi:alanine racemase [Sphingomonas sp. ABOLD]|uniref:alanine racemase n=1 Tax=Sphingomonas trueperi TaxID=53317 RepID=A0A7X6BEJ4_9SPHN|nr:MULTISPECIES: alanine racemase [Sphingomonas]NJB99001.1 alanine racemase [Sphingomonas trueperi]RSV40180.1 alanine racemase [Sphingomonas sp. ABOLD]RSV45289.1 alanine racemase [Sphingomonas sp. ABOLE]